MPPTPGAPLSHPGWQKWPGTLLALAIVLIALGGAGALLWQAPVPDVTRLWSNRYLRGVLSFSIWQASLSVFLSLLLALPIARALDRQRKFPGRALLLRLMELSLVMPTIVAVSGIVGVYGRQGWLTELVQGWFPELTWNLYGISGILLAHVFFNAPLAARIFLQALDGIPAPPQRIASQLGLGRFWRWRALEWPALRAVIPGVAALVFTLCFTSFAIVMTLGGGPATTTLEVEIYQSLRFEFDFGRAALLALVQLLICGSLWWLVARRQMNSVLSPDRSLGDQPPRKDNTGSRKITDSVLLAGFSLFLLLPLLAILVRGLPGLFDVFSLGHPGSQGQQLIQASLRSLAIALPAGLVSVICALLILASQKSASRISDTAPYLPLILPPLVLGTGLFLLFRPQLGVSVQGLILVAIINAMMALPFVLQLLKGPLNAMDPATARQADQLGILGWYRWRWLYWPRLRRPLALGMAYGTGLSLGDFGVIALFGTPDQPTLPMLLYQQLGSYQMAAAAASGLWLILLLLGLFALFNLLGRPPAGLASQARNKARKLEPAHA